MREEEIVGKGFGNIQLLAKTAKGYVLTRQDMRTRNLAIKHQPVNNTKMIRMMVSGHVRELR